MCASSGRQPRKQLLQRESRVEAVDSGEQEEEAAFQEAGSRSDEAFLMLGDEDRDDASSGKKNNKVLKESHPERSERKTPKPRLKATVTPSPVKGKGKVGCPTAPKASHGKDSFSQRRGWGTAKPSKKKHLQAPHLRSLGVNGLKMKPRLGRITSDGGLGEILFKKKRKEEKRKRGGTQTSVR